MIDSPTNISPKSSNLKKWAICHLAVPWCDPFHSNSSSDKKRMAYAPSPLPRIILLDGGISTHLESKLLQSTKAKSNTEINADAISPVFSHRELWSSSLLLTPDGQDAIISCHDDFFEAGSDVASTVTYQCHYGACEFSDEKVDRMLRDGVKLAKASVEKFSTKHERDEEKIIRKCSDRFVAASIGCYGASLADGSEYDGKYRTIHTEISQLYSLEQFHERKTRVLLAQYPDSIAYETIPCLVECEAILSLWKRMKKESNLPSELLQYPMVWMSFACRDGAHLNDETKLTTLLKRLDELDPDASIIHGIGVNCCSFAHIKPLVTTIVKHMIRTEIRRVCIFYPNSGESWDAASEKWVEGSGADSACFADMIMKLIMDVDNLCENSLKGNLAFRNLPMVVGGCCRTTPATISALRNAVDSYLISHRQE